MVMIDADFPGGNIKLVKQTDHEITLAPDLRDTVGEWFYWYFEAEFPMAGDYRFHLITGPRGPAVSHDNGVTWEWLGVTRGTNYDGFLYPAKAGERVRFAVCIPYLQSDLERWLAEKNNPMLHKRELTRSRHGRPVELLEIAGDPSLPAVLLTARHHCGETSANYVMEGFLEAMLADTETGRQLRKRVRVFAVPFVDKDGCEEGDQGKNRAPHDHARDYTPEHYRYPECVALRDLVYRERPLIVLDLHSPWLHSTTNEYFYSPGLRGERMLPPARRWNSYLEAHSDFDAPFFSSDFLPYGTSWNNSHNHANGRTFAQFSADESPATHVALPFEIPFANAREVTLTPGALRRFGETLAGAVLHELLWEAENHPAEP